MQIPSTHPVRTVCPFDFCTALGDVRPLQPRLYLRGQGNRDAPRIAIVGTRAADPRALEFARALAREAVLRGYVVVSGGAFGIDHAAHEGALEAGGETWAVLPASVRKAYPSAHAALFGRIADRGLLLSEYDDGQPFPGRFLERNRLIAALAEHVVVMQAPQRSGALSTANWAKRCGRSLWALTASPWDRRSEGNLHLIRQGAKPLTTVDEVWKAPEGGAGKEGKEGGKGDKPTAGTRADICGPRGCGEEADAGKIHEGIRSRRSRSVRAEGAQTGSTAKTSKRGASPPQKAARRKSAKTRTKTVGTKGQSGGRGVGIAKKAPEASIPEPPDWPSPTHQLVGETLGATPQHVDELAMRTGLSVGRLFAVLMELELLGLARAMDGGCYVRR